MKQECIRNCEMCPLVEEQRKSHESLSTFEQYTVNSALSDEIEKVAEEFYLGVDTSDGSPLYLPMPTEEGFMKAESSEDIASAFRKGAAFLSNELIHQMEECESRADDLTYLCEGPFLINQRQGNVILKASVCLSPSIPEGSVLETAWITREINNLDD